MNKLDEQLYNIEKQMAGFIVDNATYFKGMEKQDKDSPICRNSWIPS